MPQNALDDQNSYIFIVKMGPIGDGYCDILIKGTGD